MYLWCYGEERRKRERKTTYSAWVSVQTVNQKYQLVPLGTHDVFFHYLAAGPVRVRFLLNG